jgi:hypothetical protein
MISKVTIEQTIQQLDSLYNNASSQKKKIYYSKLGVIELCGWIESTFDQITLGYANRRLTLADNKKFVKKHIIKPNYGFEYYTNVRPMLMKLLGLINLEWIEKRMDSSGKITQLVALLQNLKDARNKAAHTFIKGTTITYDAPSVTLTNFNNLYTIVIELDNQIRENFG